jgi:DNA-nicking Smr family endonuclease
MSTARRCKNITTEIFAGGPASSGAKVTKPMAWKSIKENGPSVDTMEAALQSLLQMFPNFTKETLLEVYQGFIGDLDSSIDYLTSLNVSPGPTMQSMNVPKFMHPVRKDPKDPAKMLTAKSGVPCSSSKDDQTLRLDPMISATKMSTKSTGESEPGETTEDKTPPVVETEWEKVKPPKQRTHSKPKQTIDTGKELRLRAKEKYAEFQRLFSAAASLHDKGRWAEASAARAQAKALHEQYLALNQRAEAVVFAEMNPAMDASLAIDLHYLSWPEAEARLQAHLPALAAAARRRVVHRVRVIVGAGNHSLGGQPVLGPRVEQWLRDRGVPARETLAGVWAVPADAVWN